MDTTRILEKIKHQRVNGTSLNRFGCADKNGNVLAATEYVCFAAMKNPTYKKAHAIWSCWNGEAPDNTRVDADWGQIGGRGRPLENRSEYLPGPLSDKWLAFMLDPVLSPWRAILGHLNTTDPVIIRDTGFIFQDLDKLDFGLLFNFLIASRYCYEFSHRVEFWEDLIDNHGVDPRAAYLISIGYKKGGAEAKKPPLRKVLVKEAGYRKNAGGFRYIRDEFGDKQWFAAEYKEVDDHPDWKPGKWAGALIATTGDCHCPLSVPAGYERAILNGTWTPMGKTIRDELHYNQLAWDIFLTKDDPKIKSHNNFKDLHAVLEYYKGFK